MNAHERQQPGSSLKRRTTTRRRFVAATAALPAALGNGATALGSQAMQRASPVATPVAIERRSLLAVADPVHEQLFVYALPDLTPVGEVSNIVVHTHAGFLPLPNGELLFVDEGGSRLVSVGMGDSALEITNEAPVTGTVSHIAIDPEFAHYVAVGSDDPASPIALIDLETWEPIAVAIPNTGEVGLMMTPDTLFHRNDVLNRIEAYPIANLKKGDIEPVSTVEIGAGGHGESIDGAGNLLYCATEDGIDVAEWDGSKLTYATTHSWSDDGSVSGRGYFQRLTFDGRHIVSYISDRSADETDWTEWTNSAMVVDTASGAVLRPVIGDGYVYRFGLAEGLALFSVMGAAGDEAVLLDLDPASDTFGTMVQRIPLAPMSGGPRPDEPIYEINQYRAVTVSPDGTLGFVTHGGDGVITVLDPGTGDITGSIETPTDLDGGGYLCVFGTPESFTDTIAR